MSLTLVSIVHSIGCGCCCELTEHSWPHCKNVVSPSNQVVSMIGSTSHKWLFTVRTVEAKQNRRFDGLDRYKENTETLYTTPFAPRPVHRAYYVYNGIIQLVARRQEKYQLDCMMLKGYSLTTTNKFTKS